MKLQKTKMKGTCTMCCNSFLAVTGFTHEHRIFGLDWSYLTILGFIGNAIFSTRFLIQWIASEKRRESVIPVSFWYWSIAGSIIMCIYWIMERNPVGILAYLPNSLIYMRNLHLIRKSKFTETTSQKQTFREES